MLLLLLGGSWRRSGIPVTVVVKGYQVPRQVKWLLFSADVTGTQSPTSMRSVTLFLSSSLWQPPQTLSLGGYLG